MKKILFVLVALVFAAPAWAQVDITATDLGGGDVLISFDATSEPNLPRAFSLDIRCNNDANIVAVVPHMVGVCTDVQQGYGIFPGTIQIDAEGQVTDDGTPVAPSGDPDALPGIDSNGVTIELGSLYAPVANPANAPDPCGPLVSVTFDKSCTITITANITRAGSSGVVMESPDEVVTVNLPPEICVEVEPPPCYTGPQPLEWAAVGEPECWCAAGAPGANPRQCLGDAVGDAQGRNNYWTSTNDLAVLIAAWNKPYALIAGQVEPTTGTPLICADFDHLPQGRENYRVSANDLAILIANWNQNDLPNPTCP